LHVRNILHLDSPLSNILLGVEYRHEMRGLPLFQCFLEALERSRVETLGSILPKFFFYSAAAFLASSDLNFLA